MLIRYLVILSFDHWSRGRRIKVVAAVSNFDLAEKSFLSNYKYLNFKLEHHKLKLLAQFNICYINMKINAHQLPCHSEL